MTRRSADHPATHRPLGLARGLLAASLALAGCAPGSGAGDDGGPGPDAGTCGPGHTVTTPHARALVVTEQYGSGGGITVIDLETLEPSINVALTHDDVTARWFDGRIWVLNRYGADNLMILDGGDYHLLRQVSVRDPGGAACNPHDLLFLSTCRAYLSCFEQPSLLVLDPTAPPDELQVGRIDLSEFADSDGNPEPSHFTRWEDRVFVSLNRMRRDAGWVPATPSYVVSIDPASDRVTGAITLEGENPVGPLHPLGDTEFRVVSTGGDWTGEAAGLERIDLATGDASQVLTAQDLGGIVAAFTLDAQGCGHAVLMRPATYETGLVAFCLDGSVRPCLPMSEATYTDVARTDDGRLLLTDASYTAPGVRLVDPETCEEMTTEPIPTGFGPGFTNPLLLLPPAD